MAEKANEAEVLQHADSSSSHRLAKKKSLASTGRAGVPAPLNVGRGSEVNRWVPPSEQKCRHDSNGCFSELEAGRDMVAVKRAETLPEVAASPSFIETGDIYDKERRQQALVSVRGQWFRGGLQVRLRRSLTEEKVTWNIFVPKAPPNRAEPTRNPVIFLLMTPARDPLHNALITGILRIAVKQWPKRMRRCRRVKKVLN
ncbi:hypothetical protein CDAR_464311 [Caerostris darwini]|uniref:Uncharacterized protein n=1 Tax=Caerostris darwini TaxID=1538125 RepID=A0AAV4VUF0_9ARAC|nr:hypothetical protein CDAR_464311 [Caerostris darwini]